MYEPTTLALNLTFLFTVAIGGIFFLFLSMLFTTLMLLAGAGRLASMAITALWRWPKN